MINTVQWFIVNPVKIRLEIKKKEKIRMQKRKGTIYQFTLDTIYSAYENIKKGEFQAEIVFCFISIHQDVQSCILLTIPCHKLSQILLISLKGLVENHIL